MSSQELKELGNKAYKEKGYEQAVHYFTSALSQPSTNKHILYSNRAAAHIGLKHYAEALEDGKNCVELAPNWDKGYSRVGVAYLGLQKLDEAEENFKKALQLNEQNVHAKKELAYVKYLQIQRKKAAQKPKTAEPKKKTPEPKKKTRKSKKKTSEQENKPFVTKINASPPKEHGIYTYTLEDLFTRPNILEELDSDPSTKEMMTDPVLRNKIANYNESSSAFNDDDPRMAIIMQTLGKLSLKERKANGEAPEMSFTEPDMNEDIRKHVRSQMKEKSQQKLSPEETEKKRRADEEKRIGNDLYKKRNFKEAIIHYTKAWNTFQDITYLNNIGAAQFERGDYGNVLKSLGQAVFFAEHTNPEPQVLAKSYIRMGNAYHRIWDHEHAITAYEYGLMLNGNEEHKKKLASLRVEFEKVKKGEFIDLQKFEEARIEGKQHFLNREYFKAMKCYTEMIKTNPTSPVGWCNRAAVFEKLLTCPQVIDDCDKAISVDPSYIKAYVRKGFAQITERDLDEALETWESGDAANKKYHGNEKNELLESLHSKVLFEIHRPKRQGTREEIRAKAMQVPEVVEALNDPVLKDLLMQSQTNPSALEEHMDNADIMNKMQTLMRHGVIGDW